MSNLPAPLTNAEALRIRQRIAESRAAYANGYDKLYKQVPELCDYLERLLDLALSLPLQRAVDGTRMAGAGRTAVIAEFAPDDAVYLEVYKKAVDTLAACVTEMLTTERTLLLSPVFRDLVLGQAQKLSALHAQIQHKLLVDNPGDPLRLKP